MIFLLFFMAIMVIAIFWFHVDREIKNDQKYDCQRLFERDQRIIALEYSMKRGLKKCQKSE